MDSDEQDSSCGCSTFVAVAASVSTAVKWDNNTCPSSSSGTLPASPENTLSQDKPKPPLLGESPTKLGFGSLSRQGWFDLQSTGSSWGWDRIPGSEGGQTRAFLDDDQAGEEGVSNTPLAGLRFYYPRQRVRKHSTEEQTANPKLLYSPTKTKPSALQRAGRGERRKAEAPHPIFRGSRAAGSARGEGALWACFPCGEAPPPHAPSACAASGIRPGPRRHVGSGLVTRSRRRPGRLKGGPQPEGTRAGVGRRGRGSPVGRGASSGERAAARAGSPPPPLHGGAGPGVRAGTARGGGGA